MNTTARDDALRSEEDESMPATPAPAPAPSMPVAIPLRRTSFDDRDNVRRGAIEPVPPPNRTEAALVDFGRIGDDLERRGRECGNMARVLEQNRRHLQTAESERDAAYAELARVLALVEETRLQLKTAMEAGRSGQDTPDLTALFAKNADALQQLEKAAVALNVHLQWCRTAWEAYARSIMMAQRLRTEMQAEDASAQA